MLEACGNKWKCENDHTAVHCKSRLQYLRARHKLFLSWTCSDWYRQRQGFKFEGNVMVATWTTIKAVAGSMHVSKYVNILLLAALTRDLWFLTDRRKIKRMASQTSWGLYVDGFFVSKNNKT